MVGVVSCMLCMLCVCCVCCVRTSYGDSLDVMNTCPVMLASRIASATTASFCTCVRVCVEWVGVYGE